MAVHEYPQSHGSLAGLSDTDHHTQYARLAQSTLADRSTLPYRFGELHYATDTGGVSFNQGAGWVGLANTTYAQTFEAGITSKTGLSVTEITDAHTSWNRLVVKATSLWGDGIPAGGTPGEDVAGSTRYVTVGAGGTAGIMLKAPHIVWDANNLAEIRYGRVGGTSAGTWWYAGAGVARGGRANVGKFAIGKGDAAGNPLIGTASFFSIDGYNADTRVIGAFRAATNQTTTESTVDGVDLFIDSLFA